MEANQYTHKNSLCEIPNTLMHGGICPSDAMSYYCGRHINWHAGVRLLCFAHQVFVKPHKNTHKYTHTHSQLLGQMW